MGLDAYMYKGRHIICPDCHKIIETIVDKDECCYWRQNWDLQEYINEHIHPYGKEQYGMNIELSLDDLIKINRYLYINGGYGEGNIEQLIGYVSTDEPHVALYSADW